MPRFEFETKIGPAFIVGALSAASSFVVIGMIWAQLTGEQAQLRRDVDRVHAELNLMRAYDTSIALLKQDVVHIKDSVLRIERMVKGVN